MNRQRRLALGALPALCLTACGGGGGGEGPPPDAKGGSSMGHGDMSRASLGVVAALNGALPFPADNA